MSNFLIFKAAFNNSATPAIGTYTAEGATASFTQDASLSPDYYLYNPNASITAVQWFVPTKETTDFEFVADILTEDQSLDGDRYFIIADNTGTSGLCMLSSSSITEWRFMNGDSTATSDPEYVGAIDPTTSGGFGVFHQFRVRVRKLTASSSSVEVYVDGTLKLAATAGAALVTCAKIGFIGGVTGSPSTDSGIKNVYVYDLSGGELVDRGVLSGAFNRFISWMKTSVLPIGSYIQFAGSQAPAGFLVCNGGAISRTTYSALFAVIGTTYGSGDGSTTFNLPNLTDRFLQGSSASGTVKDAGLPNIGGQIAFTPGFVPPNGARVYLGASSANGAFWQGNVQTCSNIDFVGAGTAALDADTFFQASRSNAIYGNSSTVQPPALTCLICIKY